MKNFKNLINSKWAGFGVLTLALSSTLSITPPKQALETRSFYSSEVNSNTLILPTSTWAGPFVNLKRESNNSPRIILNFENLLIYFKLLTSIPSQNSPEYKEILDWVEQMRSQNFLEGQKKGHLLKQHIDQLVYENLNFYNFNEFDKLLHSTGLIEIYNKIPTTGNLYNIMSQVSNTLNSSFFSKEDVVLFEAIIKKEGLTISDLKELSLKKVLDFTSSGEVYNGFPRSHIFQVASSGLRSGLAYGPPGSFQVEGIFTTKNKKDSLNWAQVKARSLGLDFKKRNAAIANLTLDPNDYVFNVPDNDALRKVKRISYGISRLLNTHSDQLSDYSKFLIEKDSTFGGVLVLMSLLGAKIFRTTIYLDAGVGMGKELVIVDRSVIKNIKYQSGDDKTLNVNELLQNSQDIEGLKKQFSEKLTLQIQQKKFSKALELIGKSQDYQISNPDQLKNVLLNLPHNKVVAFLKYALSSSKSIDLSILFIKDYIVNMDFLNDPEMRAHIEHWLSIFYSKNSIYELKYETYRSRGFMQIFMMSYLNFLDHYYPEESKKIYEEFETYIPQNYKNANVLYKSSAKCSPLFL